jgi:hypothetical protein
MLQGRSDPARHPVVGRHGRRVPGVAVLGFALVALGLLLIPSIAPTQGDVILGYRETHTAAGTAPMGPMTSVLTTAGRGGCRSTETPTLPFGAGSDRAGVTIVEPRGCRSLSRLTFLPGDRFTDGLAVPAGHTLTVRVDITSVNGSLLMLRNVQLYIQRVGGANPVITATHAMIFLGAVTVGSSSTGTMAPALTYGLGVRMTLVHLAAAGHATVQVQLVFTLDDGGIVRAVEFEDVTLLLIY